MKSDTDNALWGCVGIFVTYIAPTIAATILNGLVFMKLWAWFIIPTFGFSPLTLVPALGLGMVVGFLTHQYVPANQNDGRTKDERLYGAIAYLLVYPLMTLGVGYIIHLFM